MFIESPIPPLFLHIEIELNCSVIRVPIHFYSAPPGTEALIYHLMDQFMSYSTPYNDAEWSLAFRKFLYCHMSKKFLFLDKKYLKQPPLLRKVSFEIGHAIVFSLPKMAFHRK